MDDAELETRAVDADQAELEGEIIEDDALATDSRHAKDARVSKGVRGRGGKHEDPLADE